MTKDSATKRWLRALEALKTLEKNPELTLPLLIPELAVRHQDRPALLGEHAALSYRGLAASCELYARWAMATGLGGGDVVGLLMPNCADYAAIWLGITRTGAAVALLNTNLTGDALVHCIGAAGCEHVIVADSLLPLLTGIAGRHAQRFQIHVASEISTAEIAAAGNAAGRRIRPAAIPAPADLALLIFTSGTTGLPKAAKVTHARIMEWSYWFAGMMDAAPSDRLYNCLPMYHSIGGVVAIGAMLVRGAAVVIRERFSASRFWDDIVLNDCTIFQYIGELCRYLALAEPHARETAHRLRLCCGNGLRGDVWERFQSRFEIPNILEFYAATESNVSLYNCEGKPGAIGRVPPFLAHRFPVALVKCDPETGEIQRDEFGHCIEAAVAEAGEAIGKVMASAASQFDGYTDAAASAGKIIHDVFAPGDRWIRTGDLMRKNAAGYYYFVDRIGDSFRWKGENVSTTEVAELLSCCPGIRECAVFGVAVPGNEGSAGMAAITTNSEFSWAVLQAFIEENLPPYARPVFIRCCRTLEATETFKTKKTGLRQEGYANAPERDAVWVYDAAAAAYIPCGACELEQIAAGGFGRQPRIKQFG